MINRHCEKTKKKRLYIDPFFCGPIRHKSLNVLHLRIQLVKQFHALLVHGKHDSTTQHQSRQTRQRTAPKGQNTLLLENHGRTAKRVSVLLTGFDALHTRLDRVQGLRDKHRHQPGETTNGKRAHCAEFFSGSSVRFGHLLEERVGAEAGGAVGGLSSRRGDEALEETADAAFSGDDGDGVEEAAHTGVGGLSVIDTGAGVSFCGNRRVV